MARYDITAPVPLTGKIAGVVFTEGRASIEGTRELAERLARKGCQVREVEPTPARTKKPRVPDTTDAIDESGV